MFFIKKIFKKKSQISRTSEKLFFLVEKIDLT